jgi:hypothetical protein
MLLLEVLKVYRTESRQPAVRLVEAGRQGHHKRYFYFSDGHGWEYNIKTDFMDEILSLPLSYTGYCVMCSNMAVSARRLKPSGHYMYHQFNIQQFYVLFTQCIYVFCVDLRTNSDYFPIQH